MKMRNKGHSRYDASDTILKKIELTTQGLIRSNDWLNEIIYRGSGSKTKSIGNLKLIGCSSFAWLSAPFTLAKVYADITRSENNLIASNIEYASDEALLDRIDECEIISFDVFDTLILRNVYRPSDIFRIVESRFNAPGFFNERIRAEKVADRQARARGRANSCLNEIYDHINHPMADEMMEFELDLERELSVRNPFMGKIFDHASKNGKKLVITSDTYLNQCQVDELLFNSGFRQYDCIFVSSENRFCKSDGSVYPQICRKLNVKPDQILHIGDNYHSDYHMALKSGINAHHYVRAYARNKNVSKVKQELSQTIHNGIISNSLVEKRSASFQIGASTFGQLLLHYINWIDQEANKDGVDNLYFFSRDGFLVDKAYGMYHNKSHRYIYVSRLTIRRALLGIKGIDPSLILTEELDRITFSKLGRSIIPWFEEDILKDTEFDDRLIGEVSERSYARFIHLLQDAYGDYLKDQHELLIDYLKGVGFTKSEKAGIIDVGWNGSLQHGLQTLLDSESISTETFGYYIGILDKPINHSRSTRLKMRGFAFFLCRPEYRTELYERFFTAPHGSVIGYARNDEGIEPVLEQDAEKPYDYSSFYEFEKGVFWYLQEIKKHEHLLNGSFSLPDALQSLERLAVHPTCSEIKAVTDFRFHDAFRGQYSIDEYWPSSYLYREILKHKI